MKATKDEKGVIISRIQSGGSADEAGLRSGDVITSAGGLAIKQTDDLKYILDVVGPGDQIEFEIVRRGKKETKMVQFGEPPSAEELAAKEETAPGPIDSQRDEYAPIEGPKKNYDYFADSDDSGFSDQPQSVLNRKNNAQQYSEVQALRQQLVSMQRTLEQQQRTIQQLQQELQKSRRSGYRR